MATIFSRAALDALAASLDAVSTVGQANAAVLATVTAATVADAEIGQTLLEDAWRTQARKDLANYSANLRSVSRALGTDPSAPVGGSTWANQVRPAILQLWSYAQLVQGQFPPNESDAADRFAGKLGDAYDALKYGVAQAGPAIVKAAQDIAGAVGNTAAALLNPIKWYLAGAGVIFVVGLGSYFLITSGGAK